MGAPEAFIATDEVARFIDGRRVRGTSGCRQAVYNPATGAVTRPLTYELLCNVKRVPRVYRERAGERS